MRIDALEIEDVKLIKSKRFGDQRGSFSSEKRSLVEVRINIDVVQDNHSKSEQVNTVRGHWSKWPSGPCTGHGIRYCRRVLAGLRLGQVKYAGADTLRHNMW